MVKRFLVALTVFISAFSPLAHGVTTWKGAATGYWDLPASWAGGFPTSNSTVRLNHENQTNAYTVIVRAPAITDKLWIDTYGDVPIHVHVNHTGSLQLYSMRMGFKAEDRESSFTIDGGTVLGMDSIGTAITNTAFLVGNNPDCTATMRVLNNGILSVLGSNGLIVASSKESIGQLIVTNGTVIVKDSLTLAKGPDSHAELMVSGTSSVSITGALHIAKLDSGVLAPTGLAQIDGGTLECGTLNIGASGVGSFTQSDGQVRVFGGGITLGQAASTAQLDIYGGALETVGSSMNIGHTDSFGILYMTNGTVNIDGTITLGSASRATGMLDLSGGTITSEQLVIGAAASATGTVHMLGGTLSTTNFVLGGGGTAECELAGGELVVLGSLDESILISNSVLHLEKALVKWNNPNITVWITDAISNGTITWSNGLAHGTYSTNGFDGCFTNEGSRLYWDNLDNGSSFGTTALWVEESPYNTWAGSYQLSGTDALRSADPDHDGLNNLAEYGLGGNPANGINAEILPSFHIEADSNLAKYVHRQRSDPSEYGLTYRLESCTNLTTQSWTTNGYSVVGNSLDIGGFKTVTNQIPTGGIDGLFTRLKIQYE